MMLPGQVERILLRAWDKTPNDRPSFTEIVTYIQSSLQLPAVNGAGNSNWATNSNDRFRFRRDSTLSVSDLQPIIEDSKREVAGGMETDMQIPVLPLFHSHTASHSTSRMTNEELKKKVNTHGYVLPENSYQYKYPVCTNTHLNNSSPRPFMKAELTAASASPKLVKKVEFDTDDKPHKKTLRRNSINYSPKPALKSTVNREKDIEIIIDNNEVDLCVEQ